MLYGNSNIPGGSSQLVRDEGSYRANLWWLCFETHPKTEGSVVPTASTASASDIPTANPISKMQQTCTKQGETCKSLSRPRIELRTFCVLDRCDNQLRHRPDAS